MRERVCAYVFENRLLLHFSLPRTIVEIKPHHHFLQQMLCPVWACKYVYTRTHARTHARMHKWTHLRHAHVAQKLADF